jgi:hypothetical protein
VDVEPVALRLAQGLSRAAVALEFAGRAELERNLAQQVILLSLHRRYAALPVETLATQLALTVDDTLAAVGTLVTEGLVMMTPASSWAPHDVRVELTDHGRAEGPELLNWAADLLGEIDRLDEVEQGRLLGVVRERIIAMQSAGQIPITKMCLTCRFFAPYAHAGTDRPHHCHLVDAPFGHHHLRLRCPEQQPAG